jgi:hypothetical protein
VNTAFIFASDARAPLACPLHAAIADIKISNIKKVDLGHVFRS